MLTHWHSSCTCAGCDAGRLHRLLQAAESISILNKLDTNGTTMWSNNSRSACLMEDHPNSMRALVRALLS